MSNALVRWAVNMIGKKFAWGEMDCATLTLRGLAVFHGSSPFIPLQRGTSTLPLWRGDGGRNLLPKWSSIKEAMRVQKRYGKTSEFLTMHGWAEIPKNYARTGDVAVIETSPMQTAAIIVNRSVLLIDPENGVQLQPLATLMNKVLCYRLSPSGGGDCLSPFGGGLRGRTPCPKP